MEIRKERIDMNDKSNTQAMETEKIPRLLARLAIPAVVAQIINLLYNIVDRIYIEIKLFVVNTATFT